MKLLTLATLLAIPISINAAPRAPRTRSVAFKDAHGAGFDIYTFKKRETILPTATATSANNGNADVNVPTLPTIRAPVPNVTSTTTGKTTGKTKNTSTSKAKSTTTSKTKSTTTSKTKSTTTSKAKSTTTSKAKSTTTSKARSTTTSKAKSTTSSKTAKTTTTSKRLTRGILTTATHNIPVPTPVSTPLKARNAEPTPNVEIIEPLLFNAPIPKVGLTVVAVSKDKRDDDSEPLAIVPFNMPIPRVGLAGAGNVVASSPAKDKRDAAAEAEAKVVLLPPVSFDGSGAPVGSSSSSTSPAKRDAAPEALPEANAEPDTVDTGAVLPLLFNAPIPTHAQSGSAKRDASPNTPAEVGTDSNSAVDESDIIAPLAYHVPIPRIGITV